MQQITSLDIQRRQVVDINFITLNKRTESNG